MPLVGTKIGGVSGMVNLDGITASQTISALGGSAPAFGITAPAALSGNITTGTITLGATATFTGTEKVAVFWTIAGVDYYRYDCTIAAGTGTSFALTLGTGDALPSGGQAVTLATNQDVTNGVSINGDNIQMLVATSTQKGLVEWLTVTPTQMRLSSIVVANGYDAWPTISGLTAPPSGWTGATTVVTLRFWNFATNTATMQAGVILT